MTTAAAGLDKSINRCSLEEENVRVPSVVVHHLVVVSTCQSPSTGAMKPSRKPSFLPRPFSSYFVGQLGGLDRSTTLMNAGSINLVGGCLVQLGLLTRLFDLLLLSCCWLQNVDVGKPTWRHTDKKDEIVKPCYLCSKQWH